MDSSPRSDSDALLPNIFSFLILLSYERYHSKVIISLAKVIQLCDGILASGLDPVSHSELIICSVLDLPFIQSISSVVPVLEMLVQDLFVVRASNKPTDANKDVETQREVLTATLLKFSRHFQVGRASRKVFTHQGLYCVSV